MKNKYPEYDTKCAAYHESGHMIACMIYGHRCECIFVRRKRNSIKKMNDKDICGGMGNWYHGGFPLDAAIVYYSGGIAQSKYEGMDNKNLIFCGMGNDIKYADKQIRWMYECMSSNNKLKYKNLPETYHPCYRKLEYKTFSTACDLVNDNWKQIEFVANKLLNKKKMILEFGDVLELLIKNDMFDSFIIPQRIKLEPRQVINDAN